MRLLSFESAAGAGFGAVKGDGVVDLGRRLGNGRRTLRGWLGNGAWAANPAELEAIVARADADLGLEEIRYLPTVPNPQKIICIGVNYGDRNAEYREKMSQAKYPSVFLRTRESLVGHREPILRPPESEQLDYEGEIVLIVGKPGPANPEGSRVGSCRGPHADERGLRPGLAAARPLQCHPGEELRALRQPGSLDGYLR